MTSPATRSDRLHLLDGMRGLAAFAVIVDHVPSEFLRAILPGRYLAVDFFFVLSGLVLAKAYSTSLGHPGGAARFLKLRLIRLYPMYLLGLVLGIAVAVYAALQAGTGSELSSMAVSAGAGLFFLPSPATLSQPYDVLFPFDPPAWSLFFELVANTAWVFLAFAFRGRARFLLLAAFAVWVVSATLFAPTTGVGWQWAHLNTGLARVFFSFFAGIALYSLMQRFTLPRISALLPLALLAFILMSPATESWRPAFDAILIVCVIPATVFIAAHSPVGGIVSALCDWLGKVSYGVYILHVPLFLMLTPLFVAASIPAGLQAGILAAAAALVTQLAILAYEAPVQRALRRRLLPPGRAAA